MFADHQQPVAPELYGKGGTNHAAKPKVNNASDLDASENI
jgi:hypothetical protein